MGVGGPSHLDGAGSKAALGKDQGFRPEGAHHDVGSNLFPGHDAHAPGSVGKLLIRQKDDIVGIIIFRFALAEIILTHHFFGNWQDFRHPVGDNQFGVVLGRQPGYIA